MLALREAEHTNLKLPEGKFPSRAAFSRSRTLESTATGTLLAQFLLVRKSGKTFGEDASAQRNRTHQSEASRSKAPVAGCFRQEPRFGEHRHWHNAQCAKKPLLRLREPDSVAAAETRTAKPHITGILRAALKHIKDGTFPDA
ncbi:unnamed protein product [Coccothraustes coccothraustes]